MRVTEGRMMELAATAVSEARDRAATSANQVSSGLRVGLPSDDPMSWAEGMRAMVRKTRSTFRASAISASRQRLSDSDMAFATVGEILSQVMALGVEMGNDTHTLNDRVAGSTAVRGLRDSLLDAANTRDSEGQYVLAGTLGGAPAFDATGVYQGDNLDRGIEVGEASSQTASVNGTLLTAAAGVDVYAAVDGLATAMANNDGAAIRAQLAVLNKAVSQVAQARAVTGVRMKALDDADSVRLDLEKNLDTLRANAIEADTVAAAAEFTRNKNAMEAAQAVAQQIVSMTQPR